MRGQDVEQDISVEDCVDLGAAFGSNHDYPIIEVLLGGVGGDFVEPFKVNADDSSALGVQIDSSYFALDQHTLDV